MYNFSHKWIWLWLHGNVYFLFRLCLDLGLELEISAIKGFSITIDLRCYGYILRLLLTFLVLGYRYRDKVEQPLFILLSNNKWMLLVFDYHPHNTDTRSMNWCNFSYFFYMFMAFIGLIYTCIYILTMNSQIAMSVWPWQIGTFMFWFLLFYWFQAPLNY